MSNGPASIAVDYLARNPRGLVRTEEGDERSDVGGFPRPPQWNPLLTELEYLRRHPARIVRSGVDGVYANAEVSQFESTRLSDGFDCGLTRGIGNLPFQRQPRGEVDDVPRTRVALKAARELLGHQQRAARVHLGV